MSHTSSFLKAALCCLLTISANAAPVGPTPVGRWISIDDDGKSKRAEILVTESSGVLTGKIVRVLKPGVGASATCSKCTDDRKDAPLAGLEIIRNVKEDRQGGTWSQGTILDPASGRTYSVEMTLKDNGKVMEVRGYFGISLIGRTQVWHRSE